MKIKIFQHICNVEHFTHIGINKEKSKIQVLEKKGDSYIPLEISIPKHTNIDEELRNIKEQFDADI